MEGAAIDLHSDIARAVLGHTVIAIQQYIMNAPHSLALLQAARIIIQEVFGSSW